MKKILLWIFPLLFGGVAFAQKGIDNNTPYGSGQDSIDCRRNIAFFKTYAKSQNYQDAYDFWKKAYDACPGATKDIYIVGAQIFRWKAENSKSEEELKGIVSDLMKMYDNRIKYFGNDPEFGEDYILGLKATDYLNLMQANADFEMVYNWLGKIVKEKKEKTTPRTLFMYSYASMNMMQKEEKHKEQYISDYMMVNGYLDAFIAAAEENQDQEALEQYKSLKNDNDGAFAASGAADCSMLEKIYGPKLDAKKSDKEYLTTVITLLRRLRCQENPIYYKAAEYVYAIEPSADAAIGIARQAMSKKQYDRAVKFYEEALKLSTSADEKAEAYYNMAAMAYEQRQYSRSRQLCNQAMQAKSGFGAPMLLIAQMYAATATSIYDDPVLQRVVYCLVVDKCERAKAIDPSISSEANKLIGTYRRHYPSKEDVFMHPKLTAGASFTVGGWIGETTTVRSN